MMAFTSISHSSCQQVISGLMMPRLAHLKHSLISSRESFEIASFQLCINSSAWPTGIGALNRKQAVPNLKCDDGDTFCQFGPPTLLSQKQIYFP